jgi:hypothetical protein
LAQRVKVRSFDSFTDWAAAGAAAAIETTTASPTGTRDLRVNP